MSSSVIESQDALAKTVVLSEDALAVVLIDGRTISVPLIWYPRLWHASVEERGRWRVIGGGRGIHWPDLDEDISVEGLLAGRRSAENQSSLKRWLASRTGSKNGGDKTDVATPAS